MVKFRDYAISEIIIFHHFLQKVQGQEGHVLNLICCSKTPLIESV